MKPRKSIAIMQPTYLPWLGYLDLIDRVDHFVFLDDVQFEKQSWQQRNRIRTSNGLEWITVPVFHKGRFGQQIQEVEINTEKFPLTHLKQLRQNYIKAPQFAAVMPQFETIMCEAVQGGSLAELNIRLVDWLCDSLSIFTPRVTSSSLMVPGKRSAKLVGILKALEGTEYISPVGSLDYIREDVSIFKDSGIEVKITGFKHPEYQQVYSPFMPFASSIDFVFNVGTDGISVIRSSRKQDVPMEAMGE